MTGTDEAVDRPLMEVVFDAIDADNDLADDAKYLVLAALEGTNELNDQLDGVTLLQARRAAHVGIAESPPCLRIGADGFGGAPSVPDGGLAARKRFDCLRTPFSEPHFAMLSVIRARIRTRAGPCR